MRDSLGTAAPTVLFGLMALLMSSAASAVINLNDKTGKVTYAKETLAASITEKGRKYYTLMSSDVDASSLDIEAELGNGMLPGDRVTITFDFGGMLIGTGGITAAALSVDGTRRTTDNTIWNMALTRMRWSSSGLLFRGTTHSKVMQRSCWSFQQYISPLACPARSP